MTLAEAEPTVEELLDRILAAHRSHYPGTSTEPIEAAYAFAREAHDGQTRKSGLPFIIHPLIVAESLTTYGMDADTIIAALLHDTVEDTDISLEEIRERFGDEAAELIDGVTKLDRIKFSSREEFQAATIRKMVLAMARDIRVLLIKLADRLHNVKTLEYLPPEKQQRIARETLEIYAPLAHRLGVQEIKHEMEERCFQILYPRRHAEIEELVRRRAPEREADLELVMKEVRASLEQVGIEAEVSGRPKHLYSIYRKLTQSEQQFDQIYDLIGIRIITEEIKDCYAALGIVHTVWPPIHGRFKDYIATPKFNLYQSIHTTVVGPGGKALEVQIRTREMHERAEVGIAAHWSYKEGVGPTDIPFLADIRFLQEEYEDPQEFLANLKIDLYQDEVFALTPKGDVVTLPFGATIVDFAYRIHTEVGHRTIGGKINGRLVPLSTAIESGDIVEILTSNSQTAGPSRDWLDFVRSSRAAAKIRQWFSKERRDQSIHDGRDAILKLIRKESLGLSAAERDRLLSHVADDLGYNDVDAVLAAVGDGNLNAETVVARLVRLVRPEEVEEESDLLAPPTSRRRRPTRGVIVEGLDDVLIRIAQCCAPVPGDSIVGFVTVGRGVSVHRSDCANIGALQEHEERLVEVSWATQQLDSFFVWLQVEALDRPKLLRDVTSALSDLGANIHASSSGTDRDRVAILRYEVELSDPELLDRAIAALKGVNGVFDAYRLVPQTTD